MRLRVWLARSRGATAVEYGMIIALIVAIAVVVIVVVGTQTSGLFQSVSSF